jgi:hypothetical protein
LNLLFTVFLFHFIFSMNDEILLCNVNTVFQFSKNIKIHSDKIFITNNVTASNFQIKIWNYKKGRFWYAVVLMIIKSGRSSTDWQDCLFHAMES